MMVGRRKTYLLRRCIYAGNVLDCIWNLGFETDEYQERRMGSIEYRLYLTSESLSCHF